MARGYGARSCAEPSKEPCAGNATATPRQRHGNAPASFISDKRAMESRLLTRLMRGPATVDGHGAPRNTCCGVRTQEGDIRRYFRRLQQAVDRRLRDHDLLNDLRLGNAVN